MKAKLAIILGGGGMTCSYSAGFLSALVDKYQLTDPDILIAGSGSAGTATYYVAKQFKDITRVWSDCLSTKEFLNKFRFKKVIDIDYLIDTVFKRMIPLNIKAFKCSHINYLIPVTNSLTGTVEYYSNKDKTDIYEIMRATKAMPILYNKQVALNGQHYCDTNLSAFVDLSIEKAIELGATDIIAISNKKPAPFEDLFYELWVRTRSKAFRIHYFDIKNKIRVGTNFNKTHVLQIPVNKNTPAGILDNNSKHLKESIALGYQDCINNEQLQTFLKDVGITAIADKYDLEQFPHPLKYQDNY